MSSVVTKQVAFEHLKQRELIASAGKFIVATKHRTLAASAETEKSYGEKTSFDEAAKFAGQLAAAEASLHVFVLDHDGDVVWRTQ